MNSTWIAPLLEHDNTNLLVFFNVFLQQLGVPVPSVPTMVLAGSQSSGLMALAPVLISWHPSRADLGRSSDSRKCSTPKSAHCSKPLPARARRTSSNTTRLRVL